jgi:hypothetical protein
MKAYKLTKQDFTTCNNTKWGEGVSHEVEKAPSLKDFCTKRCIHFYSSALIAVLLNPIHAYIADPVLWEAEAEEPCISDNGLKEGTRKLTTIKQIELPSVSVNQRVYFGILCAREVYKDTRWNAWADAWISGEDRAAYYAAPHDAAYVAARAARAAARAAGANTLKQLAKKAYNWKG